MKRQHQVLRIAFARVDDILFDGDGEFERVMGLKADHYEMGEKNAKVSKSMRSLLLLKMTQVCLLGWPSKTCATMWPSKTLAKEVIASLGGKKPLRSEVEIKIPRIGTLPYMFPYMI